MGKKRQEYKVAFTGLKLGKNNFNFEIGDEFFALFGFDELFNVHVNVELELEKRETMLLLNYNYSGTAKCYCDRCGDEMDLPIDGEDSLIVKFTDEELDADDEGLLYLPTSEYQVDCAEPFYESIVVRLPLKRAHDEDDCNPDILAKLEGLEPTENVNNESDVDPRWDALKNLK